jgi:hypothetical protein
MEPELCVCLYGALFDEFADEYVDANYPGIPR